MSLKKFGHKRRSNLKKRRRMREEKAMKAAEEAANSQHAFLSLFMCMVAASLHLFLQCVGLRGPDLQRERKEVERDYNIKN